MNVMSQSAVFLLLVYALVQKVMSTNPNVVTRWVYHMCRDTDIDILSSTGVWIEPYKKSLVDFNFAESIRPDKDEFKLEFSFKTTVSEGILFYTRSKDYPKEIISMFLSDGYLVYKFTCPNLAVVDFLYYEDRTRVNDNRWHNISFHVKVYNTPRVLRDKEANITVDGRDITGKTYRVSCHQVTSLVMGGKRPKDAEFIHNNTRTLKTVSKHFEGCIRYLETNLPLKTPPKYSVISSCR
ncbi:uncharacterized protein LOC106071081 [Biomphalaria glabrata]|uniref:Uncharacterized protein LOC106071081 n=1 Tax=Biomphalaria glabrata TaxID=6526 RepID=A0A9W3AUW2_BIOGL|nr:uncharacterized protein LOC106071081 [Biomphalaria glabrata]XP_055890918.1 uncharacterized protein LOC106071081 [Biomphalaria glabrata]XP_055890919.1 uncharacterized protein LOC106071081 [Biomphalaria glabrata]KAI8759409.1 sex hormone-binding globulin [Biomphalaria glabrata]